MNNKVKYGVGATGGIIAFILATILSFEGGYVNDPRDPGGETKYGITLEVAREYGYQGKLIDLSLKQAQQIYTDEYINKPKFNLILEITPAVAHKLIDAGVNTGIYRSSLWFQKALNALSRNGKDYPKVDEDGKIGESTINSYKKFLEKRGTIKGCEMIIKLIDAQQGTYYMSLKRLSDFTVGWVDNRIGNVALSQCEKYEYDSVKPNKEQQGLDP